MTNKNNKEMKLKYKKIFVIVKKAIDKWDPLGLLEMGCPIDEFENEVAQIVPFVVRLETMEELSRQIKAIFDRMFDENFDINDCKEAALEILKETHETSPNN